MRISANSLPYITKRGCSSCYKEDGVNHFALEDKIPCVAYQLMHTCAVVSVHMTPIGRRSCPHAQEARGVSYEKWKWSFKNISESDGLNYRCYIISDSWFNSQRTSSNAKDGWFVYTTRLRRIHWEWHFSFACATFWEVIKWIDMTVACCICGYHI